MRTTITSLISPQNQEQPMAMDDWYAHNLSFHRDKTFQAVFTVLNEEVKEDSKSFYITFSNQILKMLICENSKI